jgi:hypothetical protein
MHGPNGGTGVGLERNRITHRIVKERGFALLERLRVDNRQFNRVNIEVSRKR